VKVYADEPFKLDFILDKGDFEKGEKGKVKSERGDGQDMPGSGPFHLSPFTFHQSDLQVESTRLIKYFLAALTVPERDLWVNLSPYEKDRIITNEFGQTEMGRDLLAQDYLLKQITASVLYPEGETGKKFWAEVYRQAKEKFGTIDIPVDTFNKVWIVPDKAVVYERQPQPSEAKRESNLAKEGKAVVYEKSQGHKVTKSQEDSAVAYVVESRLKVMLETDYAAANQRAPASASLRRDGERVGGEVPNPVNSALAKTRDERQETRDYDKVAPTSPLASSLSSQVSQDLAKSVLREIVIPVLEKEVNEGQNFAQLRQVYQSLILASWYKKKVKESILSKVYADKKKVKGL
jgi:hypothetical protein